MTKTIFIVFGATGDLMQRKLIPAFYRLYRRNCLGDHFQVLGVAMEQESDETFQQRVRDALFEFGQVEDAEESFVNKFFYNQMDFTHPEGYQYVKERLDHWSDVDSEFVFYLAVPPQLFTSILEGLVTSGIHERGDLRRKIVFEKPFGYDLASAKDLNARIREYVVESQVYRIDHYLGKDAVQDFMVLRFANVLFEPIWNRHYVDNVQITAFEETGVGHRARYYDRAGALRDMVQNHLFQMLALIAMEPPGDLQADTIRDEKVKVFNSIKDIGEDIKDQVVFGQYQQGSIEGTSVCGYGEEDGVASDSSTETFAALKLHIDNWRWEGVPFYLRTGKRMNRSETVVVVEFKQVPRLLYNMDCGIETNKLIIRIQPEESIQVEFNVKEPELESHVRPIFAAFDNKTYFGLNTPEAYEVLFLEIMKGDQTLFTRSDGVEASWKIVDQLVKCRQSCVMIHPYEAGTRGPEAAKKLLEDEGRRWYEF